MESPVDSIDRDDHATMRITMSTTENKETARRFVDALGRGDTEGVAAVLTPDATAHARGSSALSGIRNREGILATVGFLGQLAPDGIAFEVLDVTAEDNRVALSAAGRGELVNGVTYENDYCFVMFFRDGKIERLQEMFDTKRADEVILPLMSD
jgi:hypothetical protein